MGYAQKWGAGQGRCNRLAVAAELLEPARKGGYGGGLDVDELETHADLGLDDADGGEGFDAFTFASESDAGAGFHGERLAGTHETTTQGKVRGDAFRADAGFEVEHFGVGGERIADGVATVSQADFARRVVGDSVVHGNNVAHWHFSRGKVIRMNRTGVPLCSIRRVPDKGKNREFAMDRRAKEATEGALGKRR
jgi:hypothetical protein